MAKFLAMSSYNLEIVEAKDFAPVIADEIVLSIKESVEERGTCSVALAGGATPGAIYRLLARPPRVSDIPWDKVKIFWGDERFVSHEDNQSNFKMAQETFLSQVPVAGSSVFPVPTNLKDAAQAARAYHDTILKELAPSNGFFDLVLLGMGEDGHTASLFPGAEPWDTTDHAYALAATQPESGQARVSLSLSCLKAARKIIFIVKGDSKAEAIQRVLEKKPTNLPAAHFVDLGERLTWFLDSAAAVKLKSR